MSKTNIDLNKLRNGKWNLSVNIPEESLVPILTYIDKQLSICGVVKPLKDKEALTFEEWKELNCKPDGCHFYIYKGSSLWDYQLYQIYNNQIQNL